MELHITKSHPRDADASKEQNSYVLEYDNMVIYLTVTFIAQHQHENPTQRKDERLHFVHWYYGTHTMFRTAIDKGLLYDKDTHSPHKTSMCIYKK